MKMKEIRQMAGGGRPIGIYIPDVFHVVLWFSLAPKPVQIWHQTTACNSNFGQNFELEISLN